MTFQTSAVVIFIRPVRLVERRIFSKVLEAIWLETYSRFMPYWALRPYLGWTQQQIQAALFKPNVRGFVVITNGREFAGGLVLSETPQRLTIDQLFVAPEYQRQGIGRALLQFALNQGAVSGKPLHLGAMRDNRDACAFYSALGGKVTSVGRCYGRAGRGLFPALVFTWRTGGRYGRNEFGGNSVGMPEGSQPLVTGTGE